MGRLVDFLAYIEERTAAVRAAEEALCALQAKYESYFAEVSRVRERELQQLTSHIVAARGQLPALLEEQLQRARLRVEAELAEKLQRLRGEIAETRKEAERQRELSAGREAAARQQNVALDAEEEQLKARNARLLAEIARFNDKIRQLGSGFGFFANLFRMRELARYRQEIDAEQADVTARIEALRQRWSEAMQAHAEEERKLRADWVTMQSWASALQAKLDYLEGAREQLVLRSTVEAVLFERAPALPPAGPEDPRCPRCQVANPVEAHFCQICARRLAQDRPDLQGSLEEIAELNRHHARFAEGVKAGQELIGLVRGLTSGLEAFSLSVKDVIDSERRYPLPKLQIDVPAESLAYGRHFDALRQLAQADQALHPRLFAEKVQPLVHEVLTEQRIKGYFESMGQELSRQASAQW